MLMVFGKNRAHSYPIFAVLLLTLPWLYLSFHTPFALIDDLSDWQYSKILGSLGNLADYLRGEFWNTSSFGRFRPLHELSSGLTWSLFGSCAWLHHLTRWLQAIGILIFGFLTVSIWAPSKKQLAAWCMLLPFWFGPNHPEARLAPQELNLVFMMSALIWFYFKYELNRSIATQSIWRLGPVWISFLGVAFAKEIGVSILAGFIGLTFLTAWVADRNFKAKFRNFLWIVAWVLVVLRIYLGVKKGAFGSGPTSLENIKLQIERVWNLALQPEWLVMTIVVYLASIFQPKSTDSLAQAASAAAPVRFWQRPWFTVVTLSFAVYTFLVIQLPMCLRYVYPLYFLHALGFGLFVGYRSQKTDSKWFGIICIILVAGFSLRHYHLASYQFANQHSVRNNERALLNWVESTYPAGIEIALMGDSEEVSKLQSYFGDYQSEILKRSNRFTVTLNAAPVTRNAILLLMDTNPMPSAWNPTPIQVFSPLQRSDYRLLYWAGKISRLFFYPRQIEILNDGGAPNVGQPKWYVLTRKF